MKTFEFTKLKKFCKTSRYLFEYMLILVFYGLTKVLSIKTMSNFFGWLGRKLGKHFKSFNNVSHINLKRAFPNITDEEVKSIQLQMYDNLARTFIEYFYIPRLDKEKNFTYEIKNEHYYEDIKKNDKPAILFTGHIANWEIGAWYLSRQGYPLTPIYRKANNPFVDRLLKNLRSSVSNGLIAKGDRASRESLRALKQGKKLVMLIDQKLDEGIEVPFFGHPAFTASGISRLARAAKCPIIPTRVVRKENLNFIIEFFPPITFEDYQHTTDYELLVELHHILESWIMEYPDQWFWIHRRWPKSIYKK